MPQRLPAIYHLVKATMMAVGSMPGEDIEVSRVVVWALNHASEDASRMCILDIERTTRVVAPVSSRWLGKHIELGLTYLCELELTSQQVLWAAKSEILALEICLYEIPGR
jgi:hypothetical protein